MRTSALLPELVGPPRLLELLLGRPLEFLTLAAEDELHMGVGRWWVSAGGREEKGIA